MIRLGPKTLRRIVTQHEGDTFGLAQSLRSCPLAEAIKWQGGTMPYVSERFIDWQQEGKLHLIKQPSTFHRRFIREVDSRLPYHQPVPKAVILQILDELDQPASP